MQTTKAAVHLIFVKLFDNCRQVVKPTSKRPAIIKMIQFIKMYLYKGNRHLQAHVLHLLKNELFSSSNSTQCYLCNTKVRCDVFQGYPLEQRRRMICKLLITFGCAFKRPVY